MSTPPSEVRSRTPSSICGPPIGSLGWPASRHIINSFWSTQWDSPSMTASATSAISPPAAANTSAATSNKKSERPHNSSSRSTPRLHQRFIVA